MPSSFSNFEHPTARGSTTQAQAVLQGSSLCFEPGLCYFFFFMPCSPCIHKPFIPVKINISWHLYNNIRSQCILSMRSLSSLYYQRQTDSTRVGCVEVTAGPQQRSCPVLWGEDCNDCFWVLIVLTAKHSLPSIASPFRAYKFQTSLK